jgi:integrase
MHLLPAPDPLSGLPDALENSPAGDLLGRLLVQAEASFQAARAGSTLRAYAHDWQQFRTWCERNALVPLPASPQTVILYSTDLAKNQFKKWNTLSRRLAAISQLHSQAGFESPTRSWAVKQFLQGLRRELGVAPVRKKPVLVADLQEILKQVPDSLLGKRDRALLLVGFTGAFRRSELIGLNVEDLEEMRDGMVVHIRRSKTDQEGEGRKLGIPPGAEEATCPVRALAAWRTAAGLDVSHVGGPLFRSVNRHGQVLGARLSGEGVAIVVKRYVEKLGYDPALFAGHSLRSGLATSAAAAGKSERAIMNQTGHRSVTTLRRYIRDGNLFRENAAGGIGL